MSSYRVLTAVLAVLMVAVGVRAQEKAPEGAKADTTTTEDRSDDQKDPNAEEPKGPQRTWEEFIADWMTPKPFDKRLFEEVSYAVAAAAVESGESAIDLAVYRRELAQRNVDRFAGE